MLKKVLVCDDDADLLEMTKLVLEQKGDLEVHTLQHMADLMEKIGEVTPDVILMDIWMPDIDGIEATKIIRSSEAHGEIPIVLFSANPKLAGIASDLGTSYLNKPFNIDDMQRMVNTLSKQGQLH